jgi:alpha-galactosidase
MRRRAREDAAAHSTAGSREEALAAMPRVKIVAVGAASASFGTTVLRDVIGCPDFDGSHLALVDVDEVGLDLMARAGKALARTAGSTTTVSATADVAQALPEADYVIISIAVARIPGWRLDWEVPLTHGIKHVLAENAGVGGVFQLCRNLPPILGVARAMERLCPDALILNFANPVPRVVCALSRYADVRVVGLCHGFEITRGLLAGWLGLPREEVHGTAAGINHFTWMLDLRRYGSNEDLYPQVRELCFADRPPAEEPFLQAMYRRFGLFPTCGDGHVGEFVPAAMFEEVYPFRNAPPWSFDFDGSEGWRQTFREQLRRLADGEDDGSALLISEPSEYAQRIILAIEEDEDWFCPAVNVPNDGWVTNVPRTGVVEVPAMVNGRGVQPQVVGALPEGPACFVAQQLLIQPLAARAAAEGDRTAALQALSLEPCVGSLTKAEAVFDDLLAREIQWLPQFR